MQSEYDFTCIFSDSVWRKGGGGADADAVQVEVSGKQISVSRNGFAFKVMSNNLADVALNPANSMSIQVDRLTEQPGDGSPPLSDVWDESERGVVAYVVARMELFKGREQLMTPLWAREFALGMLTVTRQLACDVMVYGNDRDSSADAMIPALGNALEIPTVSELLNLFVSKCLCLEAISEVHCIYITT